MPQFVKKNLSISEPVHILLGQLRKTRGLSLRAVADATKINFSYLEALEDGRYQDIPCATLYQKNYIKKFALAVGANPEILTGQFILEQAPTLSVPLPTSKQDIAGHITKMTDLPRVLRLSFIALIGLTVVWYLGTQVQHTLTPPPLTLSNPAEGLIAENNNIDISGTSEPETKIAINGQPVMSDELGRFDQAVTLSPGINTVMVTAVKKHGKTTTAVRHIIYREPIHFTRAVGSPES